MQTSIKLKKQKHFRSNNEFACIKSEIPLKMYKCISLLFEKKCDFFVALQYKRKFRNPFTLKANRSHFFVTGSEKKST